jgi:tetratricopeptide (TPR) repeat protein
MIPFERDERFIPRTTAMTGLNALIATQKKAGLTGMGGVGKSQLAIELCYSVKENNPEQHVIWIYASTADRVEEAYMSIAKAIQLPGWDDPTCDKMNLVWEWLNNEANGKWLLVLDSADDLEVFFGKTPCGQGSQGGSGLARYIPHGSNGTLVITTRDKRVCQRLLGNDSIIEIGPMTESESAHFLASRLPSPQSILTDELHALAMTLDNIPLAMSQAAAFISENGLEVAEYHQLLMSDEFGPLDVLDEDLTERRRDSTAHSSIYQTWKISFDYITTSQPRASNLLAFMAMLDRQDIPKFLLKDDDEKPVVFHKALGTLLAFALVTQQPRTQSYSMHRLVQLATRRWLHTKGQQRQYKIAVFERLTQKFPRGQYETREYCGALASHARLVLSYEDVVNSDSIQLDLAMLLQNLASFDTMQGRLHEARDYQKRCISIRETHLGVSHVSTLECMRELACNLRDVAEYEEAERLHRKSLVILEPSGPERRSSLLATKTDLADLLWSLGAYDEAEKLSREAVAGRMDLLGPSHADTITSMGVLSLVLCALAKRAETAGDLESSSTDARYIESARLAREVFEKNKEILGANHPQTLVSMNNLSWILRNKGDFVESELLVREALERKEKVLGEDHHDTLNCKYCLAVVVACQGRHEEAEKIYREHLEAVVRVLGKEHPNTMRSMRGLGKTLESQGKVQQALNIYREAYEGLLGTLGPNHVSTMESKALFERLSQQDDNTSSSLHTI